MSKEHNGGIDLLRLVLMFMVCILHVLGQGGVLSNSIEGTAKYSVFWLVEIFSYCAVDSFALISGFVATNKPCKYEKLINLWLKVFFYSFVITIGFVIIGKANNIGIVDIIQNAFPITFDKYWYITAYFILFLFMPILNNFLFNISEKNAKKALIVLFILFTCIGLKKDPFKLMNGYSALWLIILYCMGVLGKKIDIFAKKTSFTLICIFMILLLGTWYSYVYLGMKEFVNYISPTIFLMSLIMVILFKRLKWQSSIISKLASLSLGVYLLQLNQVIWNNILVDRFKFIVNERIWIGILLILLYASIIWIAGLVTEFIRSKLAKWLKIDLLSKKIVTMINVVLERTIGILK